MQQTQVTTFKHLSIGDAVVRDLGSSPDSCNHRTGNIVEFDVVNQRVRVKWTHEANGEPIYKNRKVQPVRTWVNWKTLRKIDS